MCAGIDVSAKFGILVKRSSAKYQTVLYFAELLLKYKNTKKNVGIRIYFFLFRINILDRNSSYQWKWKALFWGLEIRAKYQTWYLVFGISQPVFVLVEDDP
jgi:hypothetical protein